VATPEEQAYALRMQGSVGSEQSPPALHATHAPAALHTNVAVPASTATPASSGWEQAVPASISSVAIGLQTRPPSSHTYEPD